jgi:aminoglycoside 3-N-acetyltransferase
MRVPPKTPFAVSKVVTRSVMTADLKPLALSGMTVCVHSAMKRIGYVVGGVQAVVEALLDTVGPDGTVMMPSYTGGISDPAEWRFPAVPAEEIETVRSQICPYDPQKSPTQSMGAVAEYFRTYPGTLRSGHPQSSFTANGRQAEDLLRDHSAAFRFGVESPLGALCRMNGAVLLLGAPYRTTSLFHLVRSFLPEQEQVVKRYPVAGPDGVEWREVEDIAYPTVWFEDGMDFLIDQGIATRSVFGETTALVFPARDAVVALVGWLDGDQQAARAALTL